MLTQLLPRETPDANGVLVQIDDLEKEWTWSKPFDFIFSRMMTGSFASNESIVQKAFESVPSTSPIFLVQSCVAHDSLRCTQPSRARGLLRGPGHGAASGVR